MLVDAHQREPQVRLARVALGVTPDQVAADPVAQQGSGASVEDAGPHHVTGDRNHPAGDVEGEVRRQRPKHAHEGDEQDRGLQQADAEIGGKLGQATRILMHALVGIDADRPGAGEPERAARAASRDR